MTSVRKSIKAAKRKLKELERQGKEIPQDGSIKAMVRAYANQWQIAGVSPVLSIRLRAHMKAFTRRTNRKIKKQGKWAEYREFVAYQKRIQAATVFPYLFDDTPIMSYERFRELATIIASRRTTTHNNVQIISEYDETRGF